MDRLDKQGRKGISPELHAYIQANNPTSEALEGIRRETIGMKDAFWQVPPEQAVHMGQIARWLKAKKTFEIGTYTGYSAVAVASCLPEGGRLVACDIDFGPFEEVGRKYARQAGVEDKLDLREAPAIGTMQQLLAAGEHGRFDMGFVDGHKPEYPDYYRLGMALLREGGVLIVDNTFGLGGRIVNHEDHDPKIEGIREASEMIRRDAAAGFVSMGMLPVSDGVTFVTKLAA